MASKKERLISALRQGGWMKFEIDELTSDKRLLPSGEVINVSPLPLNQAFIKDMIKARRRSVVKARKSGMTRADFEQGIIDEYYANSWVDYSGEPDFWTMFRVWEDNYRDKHPEYPRLHKEPKKSLSMQEVLEQKRIKENKRFHKLYG